LIALPWSGRQDRDVQFATKGRSQQYQGSWPFEKDSFWPSSLPLFHGTARRSVFVAVSMNNSFVASGDCRKCAGDAEESQPSGSSSEPGRRAAEPKQAPGPLRAPVQTIKVIEIASRRSRQSAHGMPNRSSPNCPFARPLGDYSAVMRKTHRY
jgi:hypothetical protein